MNLEVLELDWWWAAGPKGDHETQLPRINRWQTSCLWKHLSADRLGQTQSRNPKYPKVHNYRDNIRVFSKEQLDLLLRMSPLNASLEHGMGSAARRSWGFGTGPATSSGCSESTRPAVRRGSPGEVEAAIDLAWCFWACCSIGDKDEKDVKTMQVNQRNLLFLYFVWLTNS